MNLLWAVLSNSLYGYVFILLCIILEAEISGLHNELVFNFFETTNCPEVGVPFCIFSTTYESCHYFTFLQCIYCQSFNTSAFIILCSCISLMLLLEFSHNKCQEFFHMLICHSLVRWLFKSFAQFLILIFYSTVAEL